LLENRWARPNLIILGCWNKNPVQAGAEAETFIRKLNKHSCITPCCPLMAAFYKLKSGEEKDYIRILQDKLSSSFGDILNVDGIMDVDFRDLVRYKEGSDEAAAFWLSKVPRINMVDFEDGEKRDGFLLRVFLLADWRENRPQEKKELQQFQLRHKYLFMALDPALKDEMGKIAAKIDPDQISYGKKLAEMTKSSFSRGKKANAFLHIWGYFTGEKVMEKRDKFLKLIERYQKGSCSIALVRKKVQCFLKEEKIPYLEKQSFLHPYPPELVESEEMPC